MQAPAIDFLVGQSTGEYRLEKFLGRGKSSVVYLARHQTTRRLDALTLYIIPEHIGPQMRARFLERFYREGEKIISLHHPHILPVYAQGEFATMPYLVTPYTVHGTFADVLKQKGRCEHTLVAGIMRQVVAGLRHAHSNGFIHGTLKPENIVLREGAIIQVAGFGLMHMLQAGGIETIHHPFAHLLSITHTFLAPPHYIAPEVAQGLRVDARSDVYSLGCILFEALSGRPPFVGSDPVHVARQQIIQAIPSLRSCMPDMPAALTSIVQQALAHDPERRFQYIGELGEAFVQASKGAISFAQPDMHHLRDTSQKLTAILHTGEHPTVDRISSQAVLKAQRAGDGGNTSEMYRVRKSAMPTTPPPFGDGAGAWQVLPPMVSGRLPAVNQSMKLPSLAVTNPRLVSMPVQSEPPLNTSQALHSGAGEAHTTALEPKWMTWQATRERQRKGWFKRGYNVLKNWLHSLQRLLRLNTHA